MTDKLFRNRKNLRYCAEHGIRLAGPKLGRPTEVIAPEVLKQQLADNSARNAIERKFGQCKRRLELGRVMTRRKDFPETVIAITILTANLIRWSKRPQGLCFSLSRQFVGKPILRKITEVTGCRHSRLRFSRLYFTANPLGINLPQWLWFIKSSYHQLKRAAWTKENERLKLVQDWIMTGNMATTSSLKILMSSRRKCPRVEDIG